MPGRADEVIFFLGYPEDYDTGKFDVPEISKRVKGYTPNKEGVKAGFDAVGGRMTFAVRQCFLLPGVLQSICCAISESFGVGGHFRLWLCMTTSVLPATAMLLCHPSHWVWIHRLATCRWQPAADAPW